MEQIKEPKEREFRKRRLEELRFIFENDLNEAS